MLMCQIKIATSCKFSQTMGNVFNEEENYISLKPIKLTYLPCYAVTKLKKTMNVISKVTIKISYCIKAI